jgi:hypothetical protein
MLPKVLAWMVKVSKKLGGGNEKGERDFCRAFFVCWELVGFFSGDGVHG